MNEHGYVQSVHRALPPVVYRWKIADRYTAGVPDAWYSGPVGDVWVEWKYLPRTPTRMFKNPLTPLQRRWLAARRAEGRKVAAIIGTPKGAVILTETEQWDQEKIAIPKEWLKKDRVIQWLMMQTTSSVQ